MATIAAGLYSYVTTHANAADVQTLIVKRMYDVGSVPSGPTMETADWPARGFSSTSGPLAIRVRWTWPRSCGSR